MTLIDKVLTQLEQEIESATDPITKSIGTYLLEMASKANSILIGLLTGEGKTLQSCVNYIQKECVKGLTKNFTKRPKENSAVVGMSAAQVYELALDYYRGDAKEVTFDLSKLISGIKYSQTASVTTKTGSKGKKSIVEDAPDDMPNLFRLFADTPVASAGNEPDADEAQEDIGIAATATSERG